MLALLGVEAAAVGDSIATDGEVTSSQINDPGLIPAIPTAGRYLLLVLAALLMTLGASSLRRMSRAPEA